MAKPQQQAAGKDRQEQKVQEARTQERSLRIGLRSGFVQQHHRHHHRRTGKYALLEELRLARISRLPQGHSLCGAAGGLNAANQARDHGLRSVDVRVSGPGSGRESAVRALAAAGLDVRSIRDVTPIPHNGCRPPQTPPRLSAVFRFRSDFAPISRMDPVPGVNNNQFGSGTKDRHP